MTLKITPVTRSLEPANWHHLSHVAPGCALARRRGEGTYQRSLSRPPFASQRSPSQAPYSSGFPYGS